MMNSHPTVTTEAATYFVRTGVGFARVNRVDSEGHLTLIGAVAKVRFPDYRTGTPEAGRTAWVVRLDGQYGGEEKTRKAAISELIRLHEYVELRDRMNAQA